MVYLCLFSRSFQEASDFGFAVMVLHGCVVLMRFMARKRSNKRLVCSDRHV